MKQHVWNSWNNDKNPLQRKAWQHISTIKSVKQLTCFHVKYHSPMWHLGHLALHRQCPMAHPSHCSIPIGFLNEFPGNCQSQAYQWPHSDARKRVSTCDRSKGWNDMSILLCFHFLNGTWWNQEGSTKTIKNTCFTVRYMELPKLPISCRNMPCLPTSNTTCWTTESVNHGWGSNDCTIFVVEQWWKKPPVLFFLRFSASFPLEVGWLILNIDECIMKIWITIWLNIWSIHDE